LREFVGDIWSLTETHDIVIPTNIGFKHDYQAVMGAGLAKQCLERYSKTDTRGRNWVALWYGRICAACGPWTPVSIHPLHPLVMFPIKPMNYDDPGLSWRNPSAIGLIERSAYQLATLRLGPVAMPMIECEYGGLTEDVVVTTLERALGDLSHITLVRER